MLLYDPVIEDKPSDPEFPASMSPVMFVSGGSKILGTMFTASGKEAHPVIILLHGFPGNEVNFDLAHVFRRQGFCVMVFHYRGCWGSEGDYKWKNLIDDTGAAINFIKSETVFEKFRIDPNKIILIGHSMGGFASLYNAIIHPKIKNAVSIAGFNSGAFAEILENNKMIYDYSVQTIMPSMPFVRNADPEKLMDEYIANKKEWNLLNHLEELGKKNLLLIASRFDTIAPADIHHKPLCDKLKSKNVKIEEYTLETGHSFSDKRIELAKIISKWLSKINFD